MTDLAQQCEKPWFYLVVLLGVVSSPKVIVWSQMAAGALATSSLLSQKTKISPRFFWGHFREVSCNTLAYTLLGSMEPCDHVYPKEPEK